MPWPPPEVLSLAVVFTPAVLAQIGTDREWGGSAPRPLPHSPRPTPHYPLPKKRISRLCRPARPLPVEGISGEPSEERYLCAPRCASPPNTPLWLMRQAGATCSEYRETCKRAGSLDLRKNPGLPAKSPCSRSPATQPSTPPSSPTSSPCPTPWAWPVLRRKAKAPSSSAR